MRRAGASSRIHATASTEADDQPWPDYQRYVWGYSDTRPDLTAAQIALYDACWPMGF